MPRPMKVKMFMGAKPSTIEEQINAWLNHLSSATIIKTDTVVTEPIHASSLPSGMSRPNQIRTLPRVVSGVALPYNPPQPKPLRTGLAACGGEEQDHAAE